MEEDGVSCDRLRPETNDNKLKQSFGGRETIYFGLMLSFPDPQGRPSFVSSFDDGHDIAPAVYLAVKQVNNQTDLLIDYKIEILRYDGGCDIRERTVIGANELICSPKNMVGIIGPSCQRSSKTVNQLTNREDFSLITINYGGRNAGTGNYPYAFGILGSRAMYSMAFAELIKHNNWTNYALLYSGSDINYSNLGQELLNLTSLIGRSPNFTSAIYDSFIPLRAVKESFSRVVIIIDSPRIILRTLCLAYHEGIVFPSYQWVFHGTMLQDFSNASFTYEGKAYNCSESDMIASVKGSIILFLNALQDDRDEEIDNEGDYYDRYKLETTAYSKEFRVPSKTSEWSKGLYDAVWALSYALNGSLVDLNTSLSNYELGSPALAEIIRRHMLDLKLPGITGTIKFDNNTGFNEEGFLNVLQYKEDKNYTKIGSYEHRQLNISLNSVFIDSFFKEQFIHIDVRAVAGILTITAATLVLLLSAQIVNIHCRNHKAIKASSPSLNHLIFIGGYMIVIGIVVQMVENFKQITATVQLHMELCNLVPLLLSVGGTLFLGTSCTKTWRLNRIYVHSKRCNKEDIKSIKGYVLVGFVCILVAVDLVVYILWRIFDPLTPSMNPTLNMEVGEEPVMIIDNVCHSTYEGYWIGALIAPKVLLIVALFLLALSTQINIKELKTSNVIVLSYSLTIIFGLGIPLYALIHFTNTSDLIAIGVLNLSLNLLIWICIIILILPLIKSTCINTNIKFYQII
jgi:ABC-type branched-subunit amino acid transport system substrate-binding protein